MGLDVTIYKNIKEANSNDYDFIAFTCMPEWDWKIKNLSKGTHYKGISSNRGVSCSYSSHTEFRDLLSDLIGYDKTKWRDTTMDLMQPFSELIDFADNKGCLDWAVSEKLYNDFVTWQDKALLTLTYPWIELYFSWLETFEIAKDKGVVVFH